MKTEKILMDTSDLQIEVIKIIERTKSKNLSIDITDPATIKGAFCDAIFSLYKKELEDIVKRTVNLLLFIKNGGE